MPRLVPSPRPPPGPTPLPYTTLFRSVDRLRFGLLVLARARPGQEFPDPRPGPRGRVDVRARRREDLLRSEEHTSELQSPCNVVCRLLLEKKETEQTTRGGR